MDSSTKIFIAGLVVGVVLAMLLSYLRGGASDNNSENLGSKAPVSSPQPKSNPQLVLFYMNGCGHCEHLMPTWQKVEEILKGSPIETKRIELSEPEAQGHNVRGAPTIRIYPQGLNKSDLFVEYKGDRSLEDIIRFCTPK